MLEKEEYILRVAQIRAKLKEIGVKIPMYHFTVKYPEFKWKTQVEYNRMDNLWYGKIIDEDFLLKLESFLKYKEVEFDDFNQQ